MRRAPRRRPRYPHRRLPVGLRGRARTRSVGIDVPRSDKRLAQGGRCSRSAAAAGAPAEDGVQCGGAADRRERPRVVAAANRGRGSACCGGLAWEENITDDGCKKPGVLAWEENTVGGV